MTSGTDVTGAHKLFSNDGISFQGGIKRGSFDIGEDRALGYLRQSGNPNGRPNSDVILPYANATDITQHNRGVWIIHFGKSTPIEAAAQYYGPFAYVESTVRLERASTNQAEARDKWWLHWNVRDQLEESLRRLDRWIVTPRVSKHRLFAWAFPPTYVDNALVAFARSDDYTFGVLHSTFHEVWARAHGTQLRERESGFRYTPTTCFETFPFPDVDERHRILISEAAKDLNRLRNEWLSPAEWTRPLTLEFLGRAGGPWERYIRETNDKGIGIVRYSRVVARNEDCTRQLKHRSLTRLYNECPKWLQLAHRRLDEAVAAAYGMSLNMATTELLAALMERNKSRVQ